MMLKPSPRRGGKRAVVSPLALSFLMLTWTFGAGAQEPAPTQKEPLARDARVAGQDVPVPTRKKYVAPEYPPDAAAQGIRGIVILDVLIGENGKVLEARVTRSIPGLDEAALAALKLWEYEPSKVAGKPVKVLLSQSITFAMKLPELQRAPGVPELKSGGAPTAPSSLAAPESASVEVTLGSEGEVSEAAVVDGNSAISQALLRAVKAWRFEVSSGTRPSFTIRAEWKPGPRPTLTLSAMDLKTSASPSAASPARATTGSTADASVQTTGGVKDSPSLSPSPSPSPRTHPSAPVDTDVLPARQDQGGREQGVSTVADVLLGDNIPDLVKGRRPIWPPLARLGNVIGDVVVRFSVDLAGKVTVHSAEGNEFLKASAEQAVGTWLFRRTAIDRLNLIATFKFGSDRSVARVERASL